MSWPWSASHGPRAGRSTKRRTAATRRSRRARTARPPGAGRRDPRRRAPGRRRPSRGVAVGLALGRRLVGARRGVAARRLPRQLERPRRERRERPPGGEVARPGDVDRVVALVHARRLEDVRRRRAGRGWREDGRAARPRRSGPPRRARGGRSREPSSDCESLRWTIASRSSPIRASNALEELVDRARVGEIVPGAPGMGGVEAEADARVGRCPRAAIASASAASSSTVDAQRRTRRRRSSRGRVAARPRRSVVGLGEDPLRRRRRAGRCRASTPAPRCEPDVDVDEPRAEAGRRPQLVGKELDRALEEVGSGPARFTRYAAWIATGPISCSREPLAEGRAAPRAAPRGAARRSGCR